MTNVWAGYTGTIQSGGYANPALMLDGAPFLENCHFDYAQQSIIFSAGVSGISCYDCQFVNCGLGVGVEFGIYNYVLFANCLFDTVNTTVSDTDSQNDIVYCYNSTFDNCSSIF